MSDIQLNDVFETIPVVLDEFLYGDDYLSLRGLSEKQKDVVAYGSQIYYGDTLDLLEWRKLREVNELCVQWGKGGGKDFVAGLIFSRIINLLICLGDPQDYYGKERFSYIDMMNMAYSADQASASFFQPFSDIMKAAPCFKGLVKPKLSCIEIPSRKIRAFSGHSFGGAVEGKSLIAAVLDEIAEFKTAQEIAMAGRKSLRMPKYSAEALYDIMKTSIDSRFPRIGKLILISYPRFKGDFIQTKYDEDKNDSRCFVSFATSWGANPTLDGNAYDREKAKNPERYWAKYCCKPSGAVDSFFRRQDYVEQCFPIISADRAPTTDEDFPVLKPSFKCNHKYMCSLHIDLAARWCRAGMCVVHQSDVHISREEDKVTHEILPTELPVLTIDLLTSFQIKPGGELDFSTLRGFIYAVRSRGFRIGLISLDGFESIDMTQHLSKAGFQVVYRSVDRGTKAYDDLKGLIYDKRLVGGYCVPRTVYVGGIKKVENVIINELLMLVSMGGGKRIDHIAGGSKDEADALAGAVQGALELGLWEFGGQDVSRKESTEEVKGVVKIPEKRFVVPSIVDQFEEKKIPPGVVYHGVP